MKQIALQAGINNLNIYVHRSGQDAIDDPVDRIRVISRANELQHDVIALPDFHYKVGNFIPTGTVAVTDESRILPCAVGNGSGCGYNLLNLHQNEADLAPDTVATLFTTLQQHLDIKSTGGKFSREFCHAAFRHGLDAVEQCRDDEKARFDYQGNLYRGHDQAPADCDYQSFMPAKNHDRIDSDLEVLGGGNHFVELLSARQIVNPDLAAHFKITKNQLFINFHADANSVGNMAETFTPYKTFRNWDRIRREVQKMKFHLAFYGHLNYYRRQDEIFSVKTASGVGRRFLSFVLSSANYGAVNRYLLAKKISQIAGDVLHAADEPEIVADNVHDLISFENGVWVHRTGAARATLAGNSSFTPYAKYGKPVIVPVALGAPTILGVPGPAAADTYSSLPHGAGRVIDRSAATGFTLDDIRQTMTRNRVKLFSHGSFDITREHPDGFRKFEHIRETLTENRLLDVAVILEPIAVLKA